MGFFFRRFTNKVIFNVDAFSTIPRINEKFDFVIIKHAEKISCFVDRTNI